MPRHEQISLPVPANKYTDMTISCKGSSWKLKLHAIIVCPRSKELERSWDRGQTDYLSEQKPDVLQAAVNFFYTGRYTEPNDGNAISSMHFAVFHARVYDAADSLGAPGLMTLAADHFERACEQIWASDGFAELARAFYCWSTLDGRLFMDHMDETYDRFPKVAKAHAAQLLHPHGGSKTFRETVRNMPELQILCFELAESLAQHC